MVSPQDGCWLRADHYGKPQLSSFPGLQHFCLYEAATTLLSLLQLEADSRLPPRSPSGSGTKWMCTVAMYRYPIIFDECYHPVRPIVLCRLGKLASPAMPDVGRSWYRRVVYLLTEIVNVAVSGNFITPTIPLPQIADLCLLIPILDHRLSPEHQIILMQTIGTMCLGEHDSPVGRSRASGDWGHGPWPCARELHSLPAYER